MNLADNEQLDDLKKYVFVVYILQALPCDWRINGHSWHYRQLHQG